MYIKYLIVSSITLCISKCLQNLAICVIPVLSFYTTPLTSLSNDVHQIFAFHFLSVSKILNRADVYLTNKETKTNQHSIFLGFTWEGRPICCLRKLPCMSRLRPSPVDKMNDLPHIRPEGMECLAARWLSSQHCHLTAKKSLFESGRQMGSFFVGFGFSPSAPSRCVSPVIYWDVPHLLPRVWAGIPLPPAQDRQVYTYDG